MFKLSLNKTSTVISSKFNVLILAILNMLLCQTNCFRTFFQNFQLDDIK